MSKRSKKKIKVSTTITKAAGITLLAAGVLLLGFSIFLNLLQYSLSKQEIKEYREELIKVSTEEQGEIREITDFSKIPDGSIEETTEAEDVPKAKELYILRIPKIDSENLVREGTYSSVLADALGHEIGTSYVGEGGNCVIAGHRNYSFGKFFNRLNEVEVGDDIYVDAPEGTYSYKVTEVKVVEPEDVDILYNTDEEQLTLYTCTPIYIATHRLVIIARPADLS